MTGIILGILIGLSVFSIASFIQFKDTLLGPKFNLSEASKILEIENKSSLDDFCFSIQGTYKGREINISKDIDTGRKVIHKMSILPLKKLKPIKGFRVKYPKPTKYTYIKDGVIWFSSPFFWDHDDYTGEWSEPEVIKAFNELTQAAEISETNTVYS